MDMSLDTLVPDNPNLPFVSKKIEALAGRLEKAVELDHFQSERGGGATREKPN